MKRVVSTLLAGALGLCSVQAMAYQAGDFIVRAGAATVSPNEDSGNIRLNGAPVGMSGVGLDSDTQLGLTMTYMFTDNLGVGLLAATPFHHTIANKGALAGLSNEVGNIEHLPPTLTLQYYFNNSSIFTPYIGAGVNYTFFFNEDANSTLEGNLGQSFSLDLDESWGLAGEAGVDVKLTEHIVLNAAVWYIDIDTKAHLNGSAGLNIDVDVDVDPWVYMMGVGYKF